MCEEIKSAIIGAIIGGFLACAAGVLVEVIKNYINTKKIKKLFKIAIIDDLKSSISQYKKIQEDYQKSSTVWFTTINELRKSRRIYDNFYHNILLFESSFLRERITKYYAESENSLSELEALQNRKYVLDTKYAEIFSRIKFENPEMSDQDIANWTLKFMPTESAEFGILSNLISSKVNFLINLILEANSIIQEIEDKK